jgi:hypothetical protein
VRDFAKATGKLAKTDRIDASVMSLCRASLSLDEPVPAPIAQMRGPVEGFCGVRFTSAGLNFYRDGNDSVAPLAITSRTALSGTRRTRQPRRHEAHDDPKHKASSHP